MNRGERQKFLFRRIFQCRTNLGIERNKIRISHKILSDILFNENLMKAINKDLPKLHKQRSFYFYNCTITANVLNRK